MSTAYINAHKFANVPTSPACDECGRAQYQIGRSERCSCPDTFAAPRFIASQINVPTSPVFTAPMLSALLVDAEAAHKRFVDQLASEYDNAIARDIADGRYSFTSETAVHYRAERDNAIADENARWSVYYGTFMAARINQTIANATWTPAATLDVPPYTPIVRPIVGEYTSADAANLAQLSRVESRLPDDEFSRDEWADAAARRSFPAIDALTRNGTDNDNANE
jgi:hypothetical protein